MSRIRVRPSLSHVAVDTTAETFDFTPSNSFQNGGGCKLQRSSCHTVCTVVECEADSLAPLLSSSHGSGLGVSFGRSWSSFQAWQSVFWGFRVLGLGTLLGSVLSVTRIPVTS